MDHHKLWIERNKRLQIVNALLCLIASVGRRFFADEGAGFIGHFEFRGAVPHRVPYFLDSYSGKAIFVQYRGEWRGFTGGGTLRNLVDRLRVFIMHGRCLPSGTFGPWADWQCSGDLWGYGCDMAAVREAARVLGVVEKGPLDVALATEIEYFQQKLAEASCIPSHLMEKIEASKEEL